MSNFIQRNHHIFFESKNRRCLFLGAFPVKDVRRHMRTLSIGGKYMSNNGSKGGDVIGNRK